jgi:hypothetical protein
MPPPQVARRPALSPARSPARRPLSAPRRRRGRRRRVPQQVGPPHQPLPPPHLLRRYVPRQLQPVVLVIQDLARLLGRLLVCPRGWLQATLCRVEQRGRVREGRGRLVLGGVQLGQVGPARWWNALGSSVLR